MAGEDNKGLYRLVQVSVALSAFTVVLLAIGLTLGTVAMMAKMNPTKKKVGSVPMPGPTITISDQVYNLGEPNRYLKATILLELDVENRPEKQVAMFVEEVKKREAQIRDSVIREVSGKTFREVNSPQGKEQLKEELRLKLNELLSLGELKHVLFTSFAVQ